MATSRTVTVGTTAVLLTSTTRSGGRNAVDLTVQNLGAADVFIGGSDVTTANGIKLTASGGAWGNAEFADEDALYGISGSAGNDVRVLEA